MLRRLKNPPPPTNLEVQMLRAAALLSKSADAHVDHQARIAKLEAGLTSLNGHLDRALTRGRGGMARVETLEVQIDKISTLLGKLNTVTLADALQQVQAGLARLDQTDRDVAATRRALANETRYRQDADDKLAARIGAIEDLEVQAAFDDQCKRLDALEGEQASHGITLAELPDWQQNVEEQLGSRDSDPGPDIKVKPDTEPFISPALSAALRLSQAANRTLHSQLREARQNATHEREIASRRKNRLRMIHAQCLAPLVTDDENGGMLAHGAKARIKNITRILNEAPPEDTDTYTP